MLLYVCACVCVCAQSVVFNSCAYTRTKNAIFTCTSLLLTHSISISSHFFPLKRFFFFSFFFICVSFLSAPFKLEKTHKKKR